MIRTTIPQRGVLLNLANGRPMFTSMHRSSDVQKRIADALIRKGLIDAAGIITTTGHTLVNTPERQT